MTEKFFAVATDGTRREVSGVDALAMTCDRLFGRGDREAAGVMGIEAERTERAYTPG